MRVTMGTKYQHEFTFSNLKLNFQWYSIELREKLCYLNVAEGWIVDFC